MQVIDPGVGMMGAAPIVAGTISLACCSSSVGGYVHSLRVSPQGGGFGEPEKAPWVRVGVENRDI
jgi:hypothetical protein